MLGIGRPAGLQYRSCYHESESFTLGCLLALLFLTCPEQLADLHVLYIVDRNSRPYGQEFLERYLISLQVFCPPFLDGLLLKVFHSILSKTHSITEEKMTALDIFAIVSFEMWYV